MLSTMDRNKTALERAFELAASGTHTNYAGVRAQLKSEGYDGNQMDGPALRKQLRQIIHKARPGADLKD